MESARVAAHAKLNLRLKVVGRERDGFHALQTIFIKLGLADTVLVRRDPAGTVTMAGDLALASLPVEQNLAYRAVVGFADAIGGDRDFAIQIEKRIPAGAGLGGGSADAGAVLRGLNALAARPLSEAELLDAARALGSDVPFMASEAVFAVATGRGDRVTPLPPPPSRRVVLLTPKAAVSAGDAYRWLDESARGRFIPIAPLPAGELSDWKILASLCDNDLAPPVAARLPVIAEMTAVLRDAGAAMAGMTGSGSTVFGVFDDDVSPALEPNAAWEARHTRTLSGVVPVQRVD